MNKIKDFFYNKNDIIIVLIILAVAALIIYTRIGAIMDYPEAFAEKAAASQAKEDSSTEASESTAASEPTTSAATSAVNVSIEITDADTSSSVATKLMQAGLVSSDKEFNEYISSMGKQSSIKSGTFQIPSGSSAEEILKIIAN